MNDVFTHLAAKALGAMPVVRPRPVSRFESVAVTRLAADLPLEADLETVAPPAASRPPDPAPPAAADRPAAFRAPGAIPSGETTGPARRLTPGDSAGPDRAPAPAPAVFEPRGSVGERAAPVQAAVLHDHTTLERETRVIVERTEKQIVAERHHVEQQRSPEPPAVRVDRAESLRPADAVRQPAAMPVLPRQMALRPVVRPAAAPVQDPAPIINVTIGRIEVRSVSESQHGDQARPSAPPHLSLEQYLQQRGGVRR